MSEKIKASSPKKAGLVARATAGIAEGAKRTTAAARKGAKIAADVTVDAAKVTAQATTDFAKKTGKFLDAKSRSFLEAEFAKHRHIGVATVAGLRKANVGATPAEIVTILSDEFIQKEKGSSAESEKFVASATHFVISLNEIYGDKVRDPMQRQVLLYLVLAANSKAARVVAQVGVVALSFASKRFAAIASVVAIGSEFLKRSAGKLSWVGALAKLAGIEDVARKGAGWVVANASHKILGPAPKTWPATKPAAAKKAVVKKPAAKKPAAKKA
jgi:hypothetical protein